MSTPRPSISPLSNAFVSNKNSPSTVRNGIDAETSAIIRDNGVMGDDEEKDDSSLLSEPEDDEDDNESVDDRTRRQDEVDSEAETERLELTPRHIREVAGIGRTPSKLSKVEQHDDELSDAPSPLPADVGAASSTSTVVNGKKRKRFSELDSPLTSEPEEPESPRKRATSMKEDVVVAGGDDDVDSGAITKTTKLKGKARRGRLGRDETNDTEEAEEEAVEAEPEPSREEDTVQKTEAMDAFAELAKQFTAFRDALYNERLASIEAELALLEQPQCQHPEYLRMAACVQQRRLKQDRETRAFHHYRSIATQHKILAERAQLHSQYFQTVREIREESLDVLGKAWYSIQRERRQGIELNPDEELRNVYRYVDKRSDLLRQQAKYNREVSVLAGVAKYVGFPAAPDINGIEGDRLDDDLRAMRLARPVQHAHALPQQSRPYIAHMAQPVAQPVANPYLQRQDLVATADRTAHDRFIEQNAWARAPQSHASLTSTPNISHTPEWAGFRKPTQLPKDTDSNADGVTPSGTPYAPIPDSAEQRRDVAHPESSPLQVPRQRLNGNESNGWRNYSGTSTIDAPLGDSNQEEASARKIELPPMEPTSAFTSRTNVPASLFPTERTELYHTAGFRPLEGSFVTPTPSTHGVGGG